MDRETVREIGVTGGPRGLAAVLCVAVAVGAIAGRVAYGQTTGEDGWFLNDVRVPRHLAPRASQKPVVIAIVDDAMRITHRDLAGFIWTNPREIPGNGIDDD